MGCSAFGTRPDKVYQQKFTQSQHYNPQEKVFVNRQQEAIKEMRKKAMSFATFKEVFFGGSPDRVPKKPLPEVMPDLAEFLKPSKDIKSIWFGHSTFLLNINNKIVLIDPVFSGTASPFSFMVKRFQKPVLDLSELPKIDYIIISHDHYDHLDMQSMIFFKDKDVKFIMPLGVGSHLIGWGVSPDKITELDWWQETQVDGLKLIATPAQHFSGRSGLKDNETLWASWVIQSENHKLFYSGDSGYDIHFKEIGDKYGPFDVAYIECGQYNEKWKEVHMLPTDSIQAFYDLKAKRFFPVHWGMFELSVHSWYEPIEIVHAASVEKGFKLLSPKIGQVIEVNDTYKIETWWKQN